MSEVACSFFAKGKAIIACIAGDRASAINQAEGRQADCIRPVVWPRPRGIRALVAWRIEKAPRAGRQDHYPDAV